MKTTRSFCNDLLELNNLEYFIREIPHLSENDRNKLLLIGTETLDNIIKYSLNLRNKQILLRVYVRQNEISMIFFFKSSNFKLFSTYEKEYASMYFNEKSGRYQGLGLTMVRRLSKQVRYRPDTMYDSIIVTI